MGAPQIIMIVLLTLDFFAAIKDDCTKETTEEIILGISSTVIAAGLTIVLLICGGFFGG